MRFVVIRRDRRLADAALAIASGDTGFMTLKGYCIVLKLKLTGAELSRAGYELTRHCQAIGVEVRSVPSERWGKENLYPVETLELWATAAVQKAT